MVQIRRFNGAGHGYVELEEGGTFLSVRAEAGASDEHVLAEYIEQVQADIDKRQARIDFARRALLQLRG